MTEEVYYRMEGD